MSDELKQIIQEEIHRLLQEGVWDDLKSAWEGATGQRERSHTGLVPVERLDPTAEHGLQVQTRAEYDEETQEELEKAKVAAAIAALLGGGLGSVLASRLSGGARDATRSIFNPYFRRHATEREIANLMARPKVPRHRALPRGPQEPFYGPSWLRLNETLLKQMIEEQLEDIEDTYDEDFFAFEDEPLDTTPAMDAEIEDLSVEVPAEDREKLKKYMSFESLIREELIRSLK